MVTSLGLSLQTGRWWGRGCKRTWKRPSSDTWEKNVCSSTLEGEYSSQDFIRT